MKGNVVLRVVKEKEFGGSENWYFLMAKEIYAREEYSTFIQVASVAEIGTTLKSYGPMWE